jgi:hypothetical protein
MDSRDVAPDRHPGSAAAAEPAAVRRPLIAALWMAVVLAAALWPAVVRLLGRRLG